EVERGGEVVEARGGEQAGQARPEAGDVEPLGPARTELADGTGATPLSRSALLPSRLRGILVQPSRSRGTTLLPPRRRRRTLVQLGRSWGTRVRPPPPRRTRLRWGGRGGEPGRGAEGGDDPGPQLAVERGAGEVGRGH